MNDVKGEGMFWTPIILQVLSGANEGYPLPLSMVIHDTGADLKVIEDSLLTLIQKGVVGVTNSNEYFLRSNYDKY